MPIVPRRPPRTDVGSFECVTSPIDKSKRDVFIYWQNIDDNEKCGESFEYRAYYTTTTSDNKTLLVLFFNLLIYFNLLLN
jgi:hypothetical protein